MKAFFASGRAVDLILAVILVEFVVLTLRSRGGRSQLLDRVLTLAPGALILLALRAALTGARWELVAAFLALSFPVHLADVIRRRL